MNGLMSKEAKTNEIILAMNNSINVKGNIIDDGWIENLKYPSGKTNMNAVAILSEIVYWYRPVVQKDETGKVKGLRKKFKGDKLQKSYAALGERFGLTKTQSKLACDFLKNEEIITLEFRTIRTKDQRILNNVMFIEPVIDNLERITGIKDEVEEEMIIKLENNPSENSKTMENITDIPEKMNDVALCQSIPDVNIEKGGLPNYNWGGSANVIGETTPTDLQTNTKNTLENTLKNTLNNNNTEEKNGNTISKNIPECKTIEKENPEHCEELIPDKKIEEDIKYLQEKINKATNGTIHHVRLKNLYEEKGLDKIEYYADNFDKFKDSKHNSVGYFIKAVEGEWTVPIEYKSSYNPKSQEKPIQSTNFDQRKYDDDFFDNLYDNFREDNREKFTITKELIKNTKNEIENITGLKVLFEKDVEKLLERKREKINLILKNLEKNNNKNNKLYMERCFHISFAANDFEKEILLSSQTENDNNNRTPMLY